MQRLVLAILIVAALAVVLYVLVRGIARATGRRDVPVAASGGDNVQKLAFALLIALIGYAALSGGG